VSGRAREIRVDSNDSTGRDRAAGGRYGRVRGKNLILRHARQLHTDVLQERPVTALISEIVGNAMLQVPLL
jgi:hypothetical protein